MIIKDYAYRNRKLLELAIDQACQNCGSAFGVVSAHANWAEHGKSKSRKAHDCYIAWLCADCHRWLDQGCKHDPTQTYLGTREGKREMWERAATRTLLQMWRQGLIKVA